MREIIDHTQQRVKPLPRGIAMGFSSLGAHFYGGLWKGISDNGREVGFSETCGCRLSAR